MHFITRIMDTLRNRKFLMICILLCVFSFQSLGQDIKKVKITDLEKTIAESKTPLIVNFWATFCIPCIKEMPHFLEMENKYKKEEVKLLFVSLDLQESYPAKIKAFAAKKKIGAKIVWLDEFDADYFCPKVDSSWSGAIPSTLFINNKTGYRKFFEEQFSKEKLEEQVLATIK